MQNLSKLLLKSSKENPNHPAVISERTVLSYKDLDRLCWQYARFFINQKVKQGDRVLLYFNDQLKELVAFLALMRLDVTLASAPKGVSGLKFNELVEFIKPAHIALDRELPLPEGQAGISEPPNLIRLDFELQGLEYTSGPEGYVSGVKHPLFLASSSGSTGIPKWFTISHENMANRVLRRIESFDLTSSDIFVRLPAISFLGSKYRYFTHLAAGGTILIPDFDGIDLLKMFEQFSVTFVSGVAIQIESLLKAVERNGPKLDKLRVLELSASLISQDLRRNIVRKLTKNLYVTYSSNEFGASNIAYPNEVLSTENTVGKPLPGIELKIVDKLGRQLPTGTPGLIKMKTRSMIGGYLNVDGAKYFQGGWFFPGDIGFMNESGQLIHLGRADNLMVVNGVNIYPIEIEKALLTYAGVTDAVVFPVSHPVFQHIPFSLVVLEKNCVTSEEELLHFVRGQLGNRAPARILIVKEIPRNEMGKLRFKVIRKLLEEANILVPEQGSNKLREVSTISRQPGAEYVLNIRHESFMNISKLKNWLTLFGNFDAFDASRFDDLNQEAATCCEWCFYVIHFSRYLLEKAHIPIFDNPSLLSVETLKDKASCYAIRLRFPQIDNIPKNLCLETIKTVSEAFVWCTKSDINNDNRDVLFTFLDQKVIARYKKMFGGGKSTYPILKSAYSMNIPFNHVGGGAYRLGWGAKSRLLDRSSTEFDPALGGRLSNNKALAADILRSAGCPAPIHEVASRLDEAISQMYKFNSKVVVKPVDGDRGEGVTVDVNSTQGLETAFKAALGCSKSGRVLVEKQIGGTCHRVVIVNSKMLYAVKRLPIAIWGDGRRSIGELINARIEKERLLPPWDRCEIIAYDEKAGVNITEAGLPYTVIPSVNEYVPLRKVESTAWGGVDEDVSKIIHPDNLEISIRAANAFGLYVAGVDIISEDISIPWHENNAVINEVNFSPLLGGGEISRSSIPQFLSEYVPGNGKIPVVVFFGGDKAWEAAMALQNGSTDSEVLYHVTDGKTTIAPDGKQRKYADGGLHHTLYAMINDTCVAGIAIVVNSDEILTGGIPLDTIDKFLDMGGRIFGKDKSFLSKEEVQSVKNYCLSKVYSPPAI